MLTHTKSSDRQSYSIHTFLSSAILINLLLTSCFNKIPEEMPEPGDIPISVTTSLQQMTRITTNGFEENEAIGLYITVQPAGIANTRYIENVKFNYDPSTDFVPEEDIFYPEGSNKCDFISYYPYNTEGIKKNESTIKVEVQTDQSTNAALSASDFMIATNKGVTASNNPVALDFEHKLFRLNVILNPVSGYTDDMLLAANPTVKIKEVYTHATYDISTGKFTDLSSKMDITPHGTWKIEDGKLCGKSAIIIPQTLPKSHIALELYVEDRLFECEMSEYVFSSGIAENSTIELQSSLDATKNTVSTSITAWTPKDSQWTAHETGTVLQTSQLDFTTSNVIKVMNKEEQIAEVCLEYLLSNEIEKQAVVIYPMANGKTVLTKGLVIELKGETEDKHGGSVNWDITTNSLTYTAGTSAVIPYIYITESGEIKTARPANALQIQLKPDLLADNRGEETTEYPIVKIATQYWTRSNYKTAKYTDGTSIILGGASTSTNKTATVNNATPLYYTYANAYYFYNAASIATSNLTPYGWRVGNETDYNRLKAYVQDNAAVLKNGDSWNNNNHPITNLVGFNGSATGYFNKTYMNSRTAAGYWCTSNTNPNIVEKMVILDVNNNNITIENANTSEMALSIRFIKN